MTPSDLVASIAWLRRCPRRGEVVIFYRSGYNRAGVERVMGICTEEAARKFLTMVPLVEKAMVDSGIKYWLEVSMEEQTRRLASRIDDGRKIWKLSPMDLKSYSRWYDYSKALAIDLMLATVYGCTAGLVMWWLVKLWPSLLWMVLISFVFASRIFTSGPRPLSPHFVRWSYGLSTLVFIFFPDAMTQGFTGDDAGAKFYQRILDYFLITVYSVVAVLWYDAIVDRLSALRRRLARGAA